METERICPSCHRPLAPDVPMGLCPECLIKSGFKTGTEAGTGGTAGPGFVPPSVESIAALFPQLEITGFIGKGGMGAVYKARQPALDRIVALKILASQPASAAGFTERFTREARALARLGHPNIVAVYDFGQAGGLNYFVMEYVDGPNLRQLERAGKLSPREALEIIPQICSALQFAHDEGIVHRDIKPENILLDKKGRVKIADFGIAKLLGGEPQGERLTGEQQVMGTPHYMAPEQVEKPQTVDHRADIYSLGVVFYEMLTGELPLGKFAPPSQRAPVDTRLDEVVMRSLEKEPDQRYQQASQVKTRVETIATSPAAQSAATPPGATVPPVLAAGGAAPPTISAPRFSRTAIVGAAWAPFTIAAFMGLMVRVQVVTPNGPPPGPAWWQIALALIILPLGLTSLFGTTILGLVAMSQIRRSAGRLYGLSLALLDALFYPVLILDGVIWYFLAVYIRERLLQTVPPSWTWLADVGPPLAAVGIIAVLDVVIVLCSWRAAKAPAGGVAMQIPPASAQVAPRNWRRNLAGWVLILCVGAALVLLVRIWQVQRFKDAYNAREPERARRAEQIGGMLSRETQSVLEKRNVSHVSPTVILSYDLNSATINLPDMQRMSNGASVPVVAQSLSARNLGSGRWLVTGRDDLKDVWFTVSVPGTDGADTGVPRNELAEFKATAPYPTVILTQAWDGQTTEYPDLLPLLPALRQTPDYLRWRMVGNDHIFVLTNDAGYRFEAHFAGLANNGGTNVVELIPSINLFRPEGTLRESLVVGTSVADQWSARMYDLAGTYVTGVVEWRKGWHEHPQIERLIENPFTTQPKTWLVNRFGVIYSDGGEHQMPEFKDAPYTEKEGSGTSVVGEFQRKVVQVKLDHAREAEAEAEKEFAVGRIPSAELQNARDAVSELEAELAGDSVQAARIRLETAQRQLRNAEKRMNLGVGTSEQYQAAKEAAELRAIELQAALTGHNSITKTGAANEDFANGDAGWFRAGSNPKDYEMAVDRELTREGKPCAGLKSTAANPRGFGTLMQQFNAGAFRGQRVRLSGYVRSRDVASWAGMWMRVDGPQQELLEFDNMHDRPIKGNTEWTKFEIVLDVPDNSVDIAFGLLLAGSGQVWMTGLHFEAVDKDVAVTGGKPPLEQPDGPTLNFGK